MKSAKQIVAEIDNLLAAVDSHHPDTVTNYRAVGCALHDLKQFALSGDCDHQSYFETFPEANIGIPIRDFCIHCQRTL